MLHDDKRMDDEAKQEWCDALREFQSCDTTEHLLRFQVVESTRGHTIVEKGYWLKYDPSEQPERVAALNWRGTPLAEATIRTPIIPADGVWFVTATVEEPKSPVSHSGLQVRFAGQWSTGSYDIVRDLGGFALRDTFDMFSWGVYHLFGISFSYLRAVLL